VPGWDVTRAGGLFRCCTASPGSSARVSPCCSTTARRRLRLLARRLLLQVRPLRTHTLHILGLKDPRLQSLRSGHSAESSGTLATSRLAANMFSSSIPPFLSSASSARTSLPSKPRPHASPSILCLWHGWNTAGISPLGGGNSLPRALIRLLSSTTLIHSLPPSPALSLSNLHPRLQSSPITTLAHHHRARHCSTTARIATAFA